MLGYHSHLSPLVAYQLTLSSTGAAEKALFPKKSDSSTNLVDHLSGDLDTSLFVGGVTYPAFLTIPSPIPLFVYATMIVSSQAPRNTIVLGHSHSLTSELHHLRLLEMLSRHARAPTHYNPQIPRNTQIACWSNSEDSLAGFSVCYRLFHCGCFRAK